MVDKSSAVGPILSCEQECTLSNFVQQETCRDDRRTIDRSLSTLARCPRLQNAIALQVNRIAGKPHAKLQWIVEKAPAQRLPLLSRYAGRTRLFRIRETHPMQILSLCAAHP